jgi:hypothetical protein
MIGIRPESRPRRAARAFAGLALLLCLLAASAAASATTYYVRSDGGSAKQCNGLADRAYAGDGGDCAWKHPSYALPPGEKARIAGGDTLIIGAGEYMAGYGADGADGCSRDYTWDCYMAKIPSGPGADAKTRILGAGFDSGCKAPPVLWGTQRATLVLNLDGSSNVEVGCLDLTDHSDCIEFHSERDVRCERDRFPYGDWAQAGVGARRSDNVYLHDLAIHGFAHAGMFAGGLRDWTLERVKIRGNGWVGWDGDIGDGSSDSGDIVVRDVEIAWNGCGELWRSGKIHACWAQESGGYGDGLGTAKTSGHWLFERVRVHHNTSDGIDLLYLDGGPDSSATLRQVYAVGNAGNQIKVRGTALIENSVVDGQCGYFLDRYDMVDGEFCRAEGNAISLVTAGASRAVVRHNTITGEGDCLILTESGDNKDATARFDIQNNILLGHGEFQADDGELTCGHYANESNAQVVFSGNLFWHLKDDQCPRGSVCKDPLLKSAALEGFDPHLLPGSPAIDAAPALPGVSVDYYGHRRPQGAAPDIGAVEFGKP